MTHRTNATTRGQFLAVIADLLRTHSTAVDRTLTQLARATSPLRATNTDSGTTGTGGYSPGETHEMREAAQHRNDLTNAIITIADAERRIAAIVQQVAVADPTTVDIWCTNCTTHGHREPRAANGAKLCDFCQRYRRDRGHHPTKRILDLHHRGIRLTEQMIRNIERENRDA